MSWQEYLQELRRLSKGSSQREVLEQVSAVEKTLKAYAERKLPRHPLPKLGFSEEFIMDHLLDCANLLELDSRLNDLRQTVIENFVLYPGVKFNCIDGLITNFHLPESTLIMLVSALYGYEKTMHAYEVAVAEKYRFFSFGDAMLIV